MSDRIPNALTSEEWPVELDILREYGVTVLTRKKFERRPHALIALHNAALPDSDPRKISCAKIALLRLAHIGYDGDPTYPSDELNAFADALESYLPPPIDYSITTSKRTYAADEIVSVDLKNGVAVLRDGTVLTSLDRLTWTVRSREDHALAE